MSDSGVGKFVSRLQSIIKASRICEEITYSELLGALEMIKFDVLQEALQDDDEPEDDGVKACCNCKWEEDLVIEDSKGCPFEKICEKEPYRMYERKGDQ
jgi:hypothetical protein